jgi:tetratricopeptide (TPR) repeat protein
MALNSLGVVLQRKRNLDKALEVLQKSASIEEQLGNKRGQAITLNTLGGVLQKLGKFDDALYSFQRSIAIGEELRDSRHLSMAYFSLGKAWLESGRTLEAVSALQKGFEIHEKLKVAQGIRNVGPLLIRTLINANNSASAQEYIKRALKICPTDNQLLMLQKQLSGDTRNSKIDFAKSGRIKRLVSKPQGYLYGFVIADDGGDDIYFGQNQVDKSLLSHLSEGLAVWVEVEMTEQGPRAKRVWLKE